MAKYKVLFNKDNNEDLLVSIKSAGFYNGKKDKRCEKLAETETDNPLLKFVELVAVRRDDVLPFFVWGGAYR